jgi:TonB family protein
MVELMIRVIIVGGLATGAAWLFERGLAQLQLGRRFAWTFAIMATLTLPLLPRLLATSPAAVVPEITAPPIVLTVTSDVGSSLPVDIGVVIWVALSVIAASVYLVAFVRLARERRGWRSTRVANHEVLLSTRFGPAVFGFITPRIVLPDWIERRTPDEQRLIVLHEHEHIGARDQLQLLLSIVATIAMPWNPFVWVQSRRLRFTVEADCDQRVLATAPDWRRYATLLVEVGSRQTALLLTPALAEHRNGLERRLTMLANRLIRNRWKAAGLVVAGVVVTVIACESRLPNEPQQPTPRVVTEEELPRKIAAPSSPEPDRSEVSQLIEKYYPPLLKAAGIGGVVSLQFNVRVAQKIEDARIVKSSGHEALDQAALKIVKEMETFPWKISKGADGEVGMYLYFNPNPTKNKVAVRSKAPASEAATNDAVQEQGPHFTPYTVKPELLNRSEIQESLKRNYPPLLRDAAVEGTVLAWVLIDESGRVVRAQVKKSAGHEALDSAALRVAREFRFTPAQNRGQLVKVWVQLPIVFKAKQEESASGTVQLRKGVVIPPVNARESGDIPPTISATIAPMQEKMPELTNRIEVQQALIRNYPPLLRDAGIGGKVETGLFINQQGFVVTATVVKTSGHAALDSAALKVAKLMRFVPARVKGKPGVAMVRIPIEFKTK